MNDALHIDKLMAEEEMFADSANSAYLTALYNIIYSFRYQRQPFCELRILIEGDSESELMLNSMLIVDNRNPAYNSDFNKFLATMTGAGTGGPGAISHHTTSPINTTQGPPAGYY